MLVRQFYSDKLGTEGGTWYAPFMAGAKSANILTGTNVGSNENLATSTINRYDMAQLMYNVLKAEGITHFLPSPIPPRWQTGPLSPLLTVTPYLCVTTWGC